MRPDGKSDGWPEGTSDGLNWFGCFVDDVVRSFVDDVAIAVVCDVVPAIVMIMSYRGTSDGWPEGTSGWFELVWLLC
jgi:hypothetical protein